ncbi:hypothetical protein GCM10025867_32960 [Frondihabitans sucicola]|uniref:DUF2993 domain-containing protein n=1 Tax=Frondihabitans sucicola TaxID=1268041 RepID=A0ABM8GRJ8_9MICO|nr:DUF2993 domain-containing protein [Frondihabitans sucicola]BDZ51055.1 hypothetical protein GCM10025867_32960 [Frondihabitans sucicola]
MSDHQQGAGASASDDIDAFFQPNHSGKRRRGFTVFMFVIIGLVILLAVLAVVAELVARNYAEGRAEKEIESSLPAGTTGKVAVQIHGFSVILQALNGSLDDLTLTSHDLVVGKVPLRFSADLTDVPLKAGATTGPVDARLKIDQAALNASPILKDVSGSVVLGKGTFAYDSSINILGLALKYKLTAKPAVDPSGTKLVLTPTDAAITSSNSSIDVSSLLAYLKTNPISICVAKSLPKGATLEKIAVAPNLVTLDLHSKGLPLSESGLTTTGSC